MELGSYKNLLLDRCFSVGVRGGSEGEGEVSPGKRSSC